MSRLRAAFSPAHQLADIFTRPTLRLRRNRFPETCHKLGRGPSGFPNFHLGEQPDCPSLRESREHILIVRPRRARRMVWLLPSHPSEPAR